MDDLKIDINDKRNGIWLPNTKSDRITDELTTAHKGNCVHGKEYKQYTYDKLINSKIDKEFFNALKNIKTELSH